MLDCDREVFSSLDRLQVVDFFSLIAILRLSLLKFIVVAAMLHLLLVNGRLGAPIADREEVKGHAEVAALGLGCLSRI